MRLTLIQSYSWYIHNERQKQNLKLDRQLLQHCSPNIIFDLPHPE